MQPKVINIHYLFYSNELSYGPTKRRAALRGAEKSVGAAFGGAKLSNVVLIDSRVQYVFLHR